jgi:hypothetical protein
MNYQMEIFHEQLIQLINKSGLPIGTAYYIVKDALNELEVGYRKAIYNESNSSSETTTEEIPLSEETDDETTIE